MHTRMSQGSTSQNRTRRAGAMVASGLGAAAVLLLVLAGAASATPSTGRAAHGNAGRADSVVTRPWSMNR